MLSTQFTGILITRNHSELLVYLLFYSGKLEIHGELDASDFDEAKKEARKALRDMGIDPPRNVMLDVDGEYTDWIKAMIYEQRIYDNTLDFGSFNYGLHIGDDDYDGEDHFNEILNLMN